jgi:hypothetical protein
MGLMNYRLPGLFGLDEMDPRALAEYEVMRNVPPNRLQSSPLARIWGTEGGLFIGGRGDPKGYTPPGPPYKPPLKLGRYPMPDLVPSYPPANLSTPAMPPPMPPPQRPDDMTAVNFPPEQKMPQVEVQDMPADPRYSIQPGTDQGFGSYQASAADFGEKQPQQGGLMSRMGGLFGGGPQNINLALLQAGLGTMAAGGWQKMPVTLGQAIGQGSIPAIGTHIELQEQKRRDELAREQIDQMRMLRGAQTEELNAKTAERQRMAGLLQAYQAAGTQEEKFAILQQMYPDEAFKNQLKGAEPYTLNEGDARYQGGKQIAARAKEGEFEKIARQAGLAPGTPAYQKAQKEWLQKQTNFAPPIQLGIQNFKPASETAQEEFMKELRQSYNALKGAPATLKNIEQAKAAALKAGSFLGSGGNVKREIAKFFNNNLGTSINPEGIASAEELNTRLFQQILDNLKKLDAQPSQMQQQAMQEAMGRLTTDPGALPQVLDVFGDIIREKVGIHNKEAQGALGNKIIFPYNPIIDLGEQESAGGQGPWNKYRK